MDRNSVDWKGYIPAITTPFDIDGELDFEAWSELCEWMVEQRMHGIVVAGTTGEWFSLLPDERKELFHAATRQIDGRITVIGGCNSYTPRESIEYAKAALDAGMDGILLTPPPYIRPNDNELVGFYSAVSDAVEIPICVYNWPRGTGIDIGVELALRLAEVENIVAIKNSTGDFGSFLQVFFAVKDQLRYFGFPANEIGISLLQHVGGEGTIGAGAVLGSDHADFFRHVWKGDLDAARRCGDRDRLLFDHWIASDYSPRFGSPQSLMKAALNLQGLPGGHLRPPLLPLTDDELDRVRLTLAELGLVDVPV
jgi:dihydrodipicolinate synthase/N-acetylneuraminate lyase